MIREFVNKVWKLAGGDIGRNSLLIFLALRVGDMATFAVKIYLGRPGTAGRVDFGAIDPFYSVLTILAIPVAILCQVAVKTISRLDATGAPAGRAAFVRDLLLITLAGSALSCGIAWLLRGLILSRLHLENHPDAPWIVAALVGLLFFLSWWIPILNAVIQGRQKYRFIALLSAASPSLVAILTIVFVGSLGAALLGVFSARLLAVFIIAFAMFLVALPSARGERTPYTREIAPLRQTVLPMTVFIVCSTLLMHFDRLFVRNFREGASDGYAAILTLGQIPLWIIGPMTIVLLPLASAEHARGRNVSRLLRQSLAIAVPITLATAVFFALAAGPLMRLWNPAYASYSGLVWVYALAMGLEGLIQLVGNIEIARHEYAGFWWMAALAAVYCTGMYFCKGFLDLNLLLIFFVGVRILILIAMGLTITLRLKNNRIEEQVQA